MPARPARGPPQLNGTAAPPFRSLGPDAPVLAPLVLSLSLCTGEMYEKSLREMKHMLSLLVAAIWTDGHEQLLAGVMKAPGQPYLPCPKSNALRNESNDNGASKAPPFRVLQHWAGPRDEPGFQPWPSSSHVSGPRSSRTRGQRTNSRVRHRRSGTVRHICSYLTAPVPFAKGGGGARLGFSLGLPINVVAPRQAPA